MERYFAYATPAEFNGKMLRHNSMFSVYSLPRISGIPAISPFPLSASGRRPGEAVFYSTSRRVL